MSNFKGLVKRSGWLKGIRKAEFLYGRTPLDGLFFNLENLRKLGARSFQIRANIAICVSGGFSKNPSSSIRVFWPCTLTVPCHCIVTQDLCVLSDICARVTHDIMRKNDTSVRVSHFFQRSIFSVLIIGHTCTIDATTNQIIYNVLLSEYHSILT